MSHQPPEVNEDQCHCCRYPVGVNKLHHTEFPDGTHIDLCDICFGSRIGDTFVLRDAYAGQDVHKQISMAFICNILLDELQKIKKAIKGEN